MVSDHFYDKWKDRGWDTTGGSIGPLTYPPLPSGKPLQPLITQEEIAEFRKLLERAREYDRKHNEPDCELAEKKKRLQDLANQLGVKIDFL
jgi:hypothetical protein